LLGEDLKITGTIDIKILNRDNEVLKQWTQKNMILNTGILTLAQALAARSSIDFSYIAAGTRSTVASKTDTKLIDEVCRAEIIALTTNSIDTAIFGTYFDFSQAPGMVINEVGLVVNGTTNLNSGTFFARSVLDEPIEKTAENAFSITWAIRFE